MVHFSLSAHSSLALFHHRTSRSTLQTKVCEEKILVLSRTRMCAPMMLIQRQATHQSFLSSTECVIQGTQQIYVVALWYWGAALAKAQGTVSVVANLTSYSIRPKLALHIFEPSGASMANRHSDPGLLHRHMDLVPLHILPPVEKPFMGAARICHGTGCPSLGPDALEHLEYGSVSALDGSTNRKWSGRAVIVVVVGSAGRGTGLR